MHVDSDLADIKTRLTRVEDALRVGFPDIFKQLARLNAKVFAEG